jgi:hypothetical protein
MEEQDMSTFTGGTPSVTFNNDELYRLGQSISSATAPAPTPPPGTTVIDIKWENGRTIIPMTCGDVVAVRFTPTSAGLNGTIGMAEYPPGQPCQRQANISWGQDDFNGGYGVFPWSGKTGVSVFWDISADAAEQTGVCDLIVGHVYYLNLRNTLPDGTTPSCAAGQNVTMFLDLAIPK